MEFFGHFLRSFQGLHFGKTETLGIPAALAHDFDVFHRSNFAEVIEDVAFRCVIGKVPDVQPGGKNLHRRCGPGARSAGCVGTSVAGPILALHGTGGSSTHAEQFFQKAPETTAAFLDFAAGAAASAMTVMAAVATFVGSASGAGSVS
jgi:hypothetical protein